MRQPPFLDISVRFAGLARDSTGPSDCKSHLISASSSPAFAEEAGFVVVNANRRTHTMSHKAAFHQFVMVSSSCNPSSSTDILHIGLSKYFRWLTLRCSCMMRRCTQVQCPDDQSFTLGVSGDRSDASRLQDLRQCNEARNIAAHGRVIRCISASRSRNQTLHA